MEKNIILCGFMGCGKTTVGRALAQKTGYRFVDMDGLIEKRQGKSVSEIFAQEGEAAFRRMETEIARELSAQSRLVVAAGGGALLNPENAALFRESGVIVLLDLPVEVLQERLKDDTNRPLLQRPGRNAVIRELYEKRIPLYRAAADLSVRADFPPGEAADRILATVLARDTKKP